LGEHKKVKRIGKPWFFIVFILIAAFAYSAVVGIHSWYGDNETVYIKGASDIRFGIDIRGGVDVTFTPEEGFDASTEQLDAAKQIIVSRMVNQNITDYECYIDYENDRIIVRFPWKAGEADFDPEAAVRELGETASLTFREGADVDPSTGRWQGVTATNVILEGKDVQSATPMYYQDPIQGYQWIVSLKLNDSGTEKFAEATAKAAPSQEPISIWMDETLISAPSVESVITGGQAQISGSFDADSSKELADKINSGALPFKLVTASFSTISPSLGQGALEAMIIAGVIAFAIIAILIVIIYKLMGCVAVISLVGQVVGTLAFVSGFFGFQNSSVLTIPGIAGIILSVGMGVDANVITSERIKEELYAGKTLDGAIASGYRRAFSAILDGNVTMILVAIILMGALGTPDSIFSKLLSWAFFMFGPSTAGTIYSFGYTLLCGVALNMVFGVFASRIMLMSLSRFKLFRKPWMYAKKTGQDTLKTPNFKIIKNKNKLMLISLIAVLISIGSTFVLGANLDIQFKGGTLISYVYDGEIDVNEFSEVARESLGGLNFTTTTGTDFSTGKNNIRLSLLTEDGLGADAQSALTDTLQTTFPENNLDVIESSDISPSSGREFFLKCIVAVILSFIVLVIYIAFRFQKIGGILAGLCGIIALLHDCIIAYGTFILCGMSIDANFIAVVLTILGCSINNTIVIYDRVRENVQLYGKTKKLGEIIDLSTSQSFTRCIYTSLTTVISMVCVAIVATSMNVTSILSFAIPMIVGMTAGTYSSIALTCPIWFTFRRMIYKRKKNNAKPRKADAIQD
jgi:SecD/SecF fusion protein